MNQTARQDWWSRAKQLLQTHADLAAKGIVSAALLLLIVFAEIAGGEPSRIPITIVYFLSFLAVFALPVFMVIRHRWRQENTLSRIRGLYAVAIEWLNEERIAEARRALASIRRWEKHWRFGDSLPYRLAYSAIVIAATTGIAAVHYFAYAIS
jgi:hypothetical protein